MQEASPPGYVLGKGRPEEGLPGSTTRLQGWWEEARRYL